MNKIFKKSPTQIFVAPQVAQVFSDFSQSELFFNAYSTDWVWHQFYLVQYYLGKNKTLSLVELESILYLKVEKENFPEQVEKSYEWLKKETQSNPLVLSFVPVLLTMLSEKNKEGAKKIETLAYIKSFSKVFSIGIIAGIAFYVSLFNSFMLTLGGFLLLYALGGKWISKVKSKNLESGIERKIKIIESQHSAKYCQLLQLTSKVSLSSLSEKLKSQLNVLKTQSIRISKSMDRAEHIGVWMDVEKMWAQHIPLLVSQYDENPQSEDLISKTLHAMEYVLEKHMEEVFWDSSLSISSKEKYWLSKLHKEL